MLGANLALPAAFLCVSRQLELLSSRRTIPCHPTVVRNWLIFDIFMCYLLPIIYILLRTFNFSPPLSKPFSDILARQIWSFRIIDLILLKTLVVQHLLTPLQSAS